MPIREFDANPVSVPALSEGLFDASGRVIPDPRALLGAAGAEGALSHALSLIHGGVQTAPRGAIQDPAGSAIGSGRKPSGGGGSGAIYGAFPDLAPVPAIQPRSAIFNTSTGPGRRVLHSFSPQLGQTPSDAEERRASLEAIANTYANAILAFNDRAPDLGADGTILNLTPVAAKIFAGGYKNPALDHLDPSFSIVALYLAVSELAGADTSIPALALYYFDAPVFAAAQTVARTLASG